MAVGPTIAVINPVSILFIEAVSLLLIDAIGPMRQPKWPRVRAVWKGGCTEVRSQADHGPSLRVAPIFTSFSRSVVSDQCSTSFGRASVTNVRDGSPSEVPTTRDHVGYTLKTRRKRGEADIAALMSAIAGRSDVNQNCRNFAS